MSGERIWLFDTTLRDGGQTRGVDFSHADKIAIASALDDIGIDYVEGGWPGGHAKIEKNTPGRRDDGVAVHAAAHAEVLRVVIDVLAAVARGRRRGREPRDAGPLLVVARPRRAL